MQVFQYPIKKMHNPQQYPAGLQQYNCADRERINWEAEVIKLFSSLRVTFSVSEASQGTGETALG